MRVVIRFFSRLLGNEGDIVD